ncbi:MAG: DUF4236 domain-containing protein, partial [Planctomycetaceae bacterium]|nr:DUF4236 domain-containing protein [Planctomycetaceae bacterium]
MAWNYRKRIKIAPGIHLNVSKKGVSTTFGVRGASITSGSNGTYLNTGIPGTGIYSRRKIGGANKPTSPSANFSNTKSTNTSTAEGCLITLGIAIVIGLFFYKYEAGLIALGFFCFIMAISKAISKSNPSETRKIEQSVEWQIETAKNALNKATDPTRKTILQNYISCMELNKKAAETEAIIEALKEKIAEKNKPGLEKQLEKYESGLFEISKELEKVQIDVDADLDDVEKWQYSKLCERFEKLISSEKIWIITSSVRNTELKSSAEISVERKVVNFDTGVFNYIKSFFDIPMFRDWQGDIYYIYPQYIIKARSSFDFEVFPLETIDFEYSKQRFIEDEPLPKDASLRNYTYQYVNNNGEPDKRYSYNPRRPLVEYGKLTIEKFGLLYYVSDKLATESFVRIYQTWKNRKNVGNGDEPQQHFDISESYFDTINGAVEKIIILFETLKKDGAFQSHAENKVKIRLNISGKDCTDFSEKLRTLFLIDITKCYIELNHPIDLDTKEGFGLLLLFTGTSGLDKISFVTLNTAVNKSLVDSAEKYINRLKTAILTNSIPDMEEKFIISKVLREYNPELQKQYLILLYRFASITAKADGTVNEIEAEWLSKILNLSQKTSIVGVGGNVVISDNEPGQAENNTTLNKPRATPGKTKKPETAKLKSLIGLSSVKEEIETLTNFIKIQQAREAKGLKTSSVSYHCVFTGNPGTGKTTVARIVADIYKSLGILTKGHLVETDRSGLVAEYVGQTAVKTNKIIDEALDGVLFIDEAYSLISKSDNDYGKEAIATLLKRMEDNRTRLVVILAGYSAEMQQFIDSNPGLQSRFNRY